MHARTHARTHVGAYTYGAVFTGLPRVSIATDSRNRYGRRKREAMRASDVKRSASETYFRIIFDEDNTDREARKIIRF